MWMSFSAVWRGSPPSRPSAERSSSRCHCVAVIVLIDQSPATHFDLSPNPLAASVDNQRTWHLSRHSRVICCRGRSRLNFHTELLQCFRREAFETTGGDNSTRYGTHTGLRINPGPDPNEHASLPKLS